MDYRNLSGFGMIFLHRECGSVGDCIMSLSKFKYNLAGFYYETIATGVKKVMVILTDIADISTSNWLNPIDIEDLNGDMSIQHGIIRPFSKPKKSNIFKEVLAKILVKKNFYTNSSSILIQDWLYYIIGLDYMKFYTDDTDDTDDVISPIHSDNPSSKSPKMKSSHSDEAKSYIPPQHQTSIYSLNVIIAEIYSRVSSRTKITSASLDNIHRYMLIEADIFNKPISLIFNDHDSDEYYEGIHITNPHVLIQMIARNFTQLYMTDERFSKQFNSLMSHGHLNHSIHDDIIIQNLINSGDELLSFLHRSIHDKSLNMVMLSEVIGVYENDKSIVQSNIGGTKTLPDYRKEALLPPEHRPLGSWTFKSKVRETLSPLDISNLSDQDVSSDNNGERDFSRLDPSLLRVSRGDYHPNESIISIHQEIRKISESLIQGETPLININHLIKQVNSLTALSGLSLDRINTIKGNISMASVIVVSSENEGIPLSLSSGRRILLPLVNPDLTIFDVNQLTEILSMLDVISDGDARFDNLRAKIVARLAI